MAMKALFNIFGNHVDFFTDRLCRIYSFLLFIALAIGFAVEFNKDNAVTCWAPSQFTASHLMYTNEVCKYSDSLYVPISDNIPNIPGNAMKHTYLNFGKIRYLPVVMAAQALLFLVPWLFWKVVSSGCCSLQGLVNDSSKMVSSNDDKIGKTITSEILKLKSTGYSVVFGFSYLLTKAFYWMICLIQMGILSNFLNVNFFTYRYNQTSYAPFQQIVGNKTSMPFPRIVLCDYEIRQQGRVHSYVVQCFLPISDTIERYMYIIWVWLIVILVVMALTGTFYLFKLMFLLIGIKSVKDSFITRKLNNINSSDAGTKRAIIIDKFSKQYLNAGMFLAFEILEENGSLHAVSIAVNQMWEEFLQSSKIEVEGQGLPAGHTQGYPHQVDECTPLAVMGSSPDKRSSPYATVQKEMKQVQ